MKNSMKKIISKLRNALAKTTKGKWELKIFPDGGAFIHAPEPKERNFGYGIEVFGDDINQYETWREDMEFAIAAHELLPSLLDYIEQLEKDIRRKTDEKY